jgi:two-component system, OmpR family, sensor kinase
MTTKSINLRTRLAMRQTLIFSAAALVFTTMAYLVIARLQYQVVDSQLEDRGSAVRSLLQIRNGHAQWLHEQADPEVKEKFARSHQYFQLIDREGRVIDTSRDATIETMPVTKAALRAFDSHWPVWESVHGVGENHLRVLDSFVTSNEGQGYVVRVAMSLADADGDCQRILMLLLILVPLIVAIHAVCTYAAAGRALQPLRDLADAARNLSPHDLSRRLPDVRTGDEIEMLSTSFNRLVGDMETNVNQMREFLPNVSHELRSPLAVLRAETERALRWANSEQEFRDALSSQLEHLERMATTMTDLLAVALSDGEGMKLHCRPENISELAMVAVEGMRHVATEKKVELRSSVWDEVVANVDAGQLWRLLLNLLDNAIKYNRPNGQVELSVQSHGSTIEIAVSDTGRGIAPEELPHVFNRFYRSAEVKRSGIKGHGLGLAFAKEVAEAHGGSIKVSSIIGRGSRFAITLPIIATETGNNRSALQGASEIAAD